METSATDRVGGMSTFWLLEEGSFGYEHGEIIGAFNDKKDIPAWIRCNKKVEVR